MKRVLLATPVYDQKPDARYVHAFGQTIKACMQNEIDLRWLFPIGETIQSARNGIVRDAVKFEFDELVWIDADQDWSVDGPGPNEFLTILNYPVDVVGAPVRRKTIEHEIYNVRAEAGPHGLTTDPKTGLMTAPDMALGCGFLRMSKRAFTALWNDGEPYTTFMNENDPSRWIFDIRPVKEAGDSIAELHGEDTWACDALRRLGFQIWMDPKINPGHIGLIRIQGNYLDWLERAKRDNPKPSDKVVNLR